PRRAGPRSENFVTSAQVTSAATSHPQRTRLRRVANQEDGAAKGAQPMCCFSRPVQRVSDTQIFARSSREGRQFVVYSMEVSAKEDLAMILPIPVPRNTKEEAVRFINLEKYAEFFSDMLAGFPAPQPPRMAGFPGGFGGIANGGAPLKVVDVGSFEASFVPSVKDFERLDERFRLPSA